MFRKKLTSWLVYGMLSIGLLTGCKSTNDGAGKHVSEDRTGTDGRTAALATGNTGGATHEALTITSNSGLDEFQELVHAKYPEIRFEILPYAGSNWSRHTSDQLLTGNLPDIYTAGDAWQSYPKEVTTRLLDLSNYAFTELYDPTLLTQQDVDGGLYLLPSDYYVFYIAYNQTLFEKMGWDVPNSFRELQALAPDIREAGVDLAVTDASSADMVFQYVCALADTIDLSSIKGVKWQRNFLAGDANAAEGFGDAMDYLEQWVDLGMIEGSGATAGESAFEQFAEGKTAFLVGEVSRWTQNKDGSGDRYAPMPYLSKDGTNNMYVTTIAQYFGLSADLASPGNEQKLTDALHVMEVISTPEGQRAFTQTNSISLPSLRKWTVETDNPLSACMGLLSAGQSAPAIYAGWEGFLSHIGQKVLTYLDGACTKEEVIAFMDTVCGAYLSNGTYAYATVDQDYSTEEVAILVGKVFGEAVDADVALVSVNALRAGGAVQNDAGVNGALPALPLTEERIVSFLPTGWSGTIQTVTLTGAQIRHLKKEGYVCEKDGKIASFPYVATVRGGKEMRDDRAYVVAICGIGEELKKTGRVTDSGIVGLQAFKDYFRHQEQPILARESLLWNI